MSLRDRWRFNAIFALGFALVLGSLLPPGPLVSGLIGGGIAAVCWWIGDLSDKSQP